MMSSDVTVVITSCGRQDLLEHTVDSFLRWNTYPIARYVVTEDSGIRHVNDALKRKYAALPIRWIERGRRGQLFCVDDAYAQVKTPYIFHCEDDWEFYGRGFIEASRAILERRPEIMQVHIRSEDDTGGHPLEPDVQVVHGPMGEIRFRQLSFGFEGHWHGFSLNPGLRRLADYRRIGRYVPFRYEAHISEVYKRHGYCAVTLCGAGYVRHLGDGRRIVLGNSSGVFLKPPDPAWRRLLGRARSRHPRVYSAIKSIVAPLRRR